MEKKINTWIRRISPVTLTAAIISPAMVNKVMSMFGSLVCQRGGGGVVQTEKKLQEAGPYKA